MYRDDGMGRGLLHESRRVADVVPQRCEFGPPPFCASARVLVSARRTHLRSALTPPPSPCSPPGSSRVLQGGGVGFTVTGLTVLKCECAGGGAGGT